MIRRDIELADGAPGWLLISQIEHARISGEFAATCRREFLFDRDQGSDTRTIAALDAVAQEVLAAVVHHDDGWAPWERRPRLDPERGWPLEFTELAPAEAVEIWSRSAAAAAAIGPLAAWTVAGHFSRLLDLAEHLGDDPAAQAWRRSTDARREAWLAAWIEAEPALRTPELAERALEWVWTFDELSLWFCCHAPPGDDGASPPPRHHRAGHGTPLEMELQDEAPAPPDLSHAGLAIARPWRFDATAIDVAAAGIAAPRSMYTDWDALLAASQPAELTWRLAPAEPVNLDSPPTIFHG